MIAVITVFYILSSIALFIYSYGFLDFNLTLSSNPVFLKFVAPLQHLVYFNRPLSIQIYALIMLTMFVSYIGVMIKWSNCKISYFPWKLFLTIIFILTLSYPMLSYDVFNYMFHGKILWLYHQNPHLHAPLEYSGDLWLRFMRWVHTPSAYGPVFTVIESPAYLLGLGKFVPVLILMKIAMTSFFVWCIYLVGKIGETLGFKRDQRVFSQIILAFNPFLLIEVVLNGHNDAVMMALFLLSLLYSLKTKLLPSLISIFASIGTKYVSVLTLPSYFIHSPKHKTWYIFLAMLLPVLLFLARFQPWYLVWALIPAALIDHSLTRHWIILSSLAGTIFYAPYIQTGFWLNSLPFVAVIVYLPIILSLGLWLGPILNLHNSSGSSLRKKNNI